MLTQFGQSVSWFVKQTPDGTVHDAWVRHEFPQGIPLFLGVCSSACVHVCVRVFKGRVSLLYVVYKEAKWKPIGFGGCRSWEAPQGSPRHVTQRYVCGRDRNMVAEPKLKG